MLSRLRSRVPSHTTVVAYLALFLAVGGGTTAVALQGRNTVNSGDIINQEVKSNDVQENGIRSEDVRDDGLPNGGLTGADIDDSTLTGLVRNSTYRLGQGQERAGTTLGDGTKVLSQSCQPGDRLLSGGPASVNANSDVLDSFPPDINTWQARINDSAVSGGDSFTVAILCADQ